jgi:hypothetical protein
MEVKTSEAHMELAPAETPNLAQRFTRVPAIIVGVVIGPIADISFAAPNVRFRG